jgi:hypothetical protein
VWRAGLDYVNEVEPRVCLQLDLVHVYAETSRRSCSGRQVRDLTTAYEARKSPRGDYCSSYTFLKWNAFLSFASPPRWVDEEMERFGTRLMALNDWGVNSHEGELLKYMKGWMSKGERLKTAERRRRGKLRKAREGRTIGGALQPRYGFKYVRKLRVRQWAMRLTQRRWRTCA